MEIGRLKFALALVEGRLHKAVGDKRCGCGQCAHWVTVAAQRAGIACDELEAALAPVAKPQRRRQRRPRPMGVQVCDSATIRVRGRDVDPREGLAILLARLHDSG
ncbi:hypothetical protein [Mycobacterium sp.]|uniref:hypothetical protein n=1 Tax=Mycobacterium sp. TaxID=1785 RepID=UPI002C52F391|nr:hypothetical protein [Mycobacterium sp.]HTQ22633.1 hypothetical protein [Mycobacterium sp.]